MKNTQSLFRLVPMFLGSLFLSLPHSAIAAEVPKLDSAWSHYLGTLDTEKVQPGCVPKRVQPPEGTATRGTILFIHGYTACPQQYFEWADQLAAQGFEVLMPLLPGHGRAQPAPQVDDFSGLPTLKNWQLYDQFAEQMNELSQSITGPRMIAGLSVGAIVALDAANKAPDLYEKMMLISPYFESSDDYTIPKTFIHKLPVKEVIDLEVATHIGQQIPMSWGSGCYDEVRRGRAGICNFELGDVSGISKFGKETLKISKPLPNVKTQIVIVEKDPVATNGDQITLIKKMGGIPNVAACTLPVGVNHSAVSRFDSPDEKKWWIPGLLQQGTAFFAGGQPMPYAGPSILKNFSQCAVGQTQD